MSEEITGFVHRAMFVETLYAPFAAAICEGFEPVSGAGMFQTSVYDSEGNVIYKVSNGMISAKFAEAIDDKTGAALFAMCQAAGSNVTEEQCQMLMAATISSPDRQAYDMAMENGWTFHDPNAPDIL